MLGGDELSDAIHDLGDVFARFSLFFVVFFRFFAL